LVQPGHLGIEGHLLADKLIMAWSCPPLGVVLSGAGSCLLLLLVSLPLIEEELHSWLEHCHPHCDHQDGLESQSVL
jgi:hypothetical protein